MIHGGMMVLQTITVSSLPTRPMQLGSRRFQPDAEKKASGVKSWPYYKTINIILSCTYMYNLM